LGTSGHFGHMKKNPGTQKTKPLTPVFDEKRNSWRLSVPASLAPDGKRQRVFFASEKLASLEVERINGTAKRWGSEVRKIKASTAEDAAKALEILDGRDISLSSLARLYVEAEAKRAASKTFAEVWSEYRIKLDHKVSNRGKAISERTKSNKEKLVAPLLDLIGGQMLCDISAKSLESAMAKSYGTASIFNSARAHLSPIFAHGVRMKYAAENPMVMIEKNAEADKETTVATVAQISAALAACRDHRNSDTLKKHLHVDATDALTAIAILCFAGIRPESELPKLNWSQIRMDGANPHIRIKKSGTKGRGGRSVPIEPNLMEWLEAVPTDERFGSVAPEANWRRKWQIVRKMAGFGKDADILRHSYASYYHAGVNDDINKLRANLGHDTSDVIFNHYLDTDVESADALKFWSIVPTENEVELEASA